MYGNVMLCYVMVCYVLLCVVMCCYVMACHVISFHVMFVYVYVMLCNVMYVHTMLMSFVQILEPLLFWTIQENFDPCQPPHIGRLPLLGGKTENVKSYRTSWKIWRRNVLVTSTYVSSTPAICTKTSGSLLKVSSTFDPLVLWRKARQINPDWFLQIMSWEPTTVCQHRNSTHSAAWTNVTLTSASWKRLLRKPKFQQMICRLRSQRFCRNLTPKACSKSCRRSPKDMAER